MPAKILPTCSTPLVNVNYERLQCFASKEQKKGLLNVCLVYSSVYLLVNLSNILCDMMTNSVKKFCCCLSLALSYFIAKKSFVS